jgi:hypothetical protein
MLRWESYCVRVTAELISYLLMTAQKYVHKQTLKIRGTKDDIFSYFSKILFDWRRLERFWITFCDKRKNQDFRLLKGVERDSGLPSKDKEGVEM